MSAFDAVFGEDMQNLGAIWTSLESGAFTGMMLNCQERRICWTHEEIDRRVGAERMPPGLAVQQVLAPFVEVAEPDAAG